MSERTGNRWLGIASRTADFIFGGLMILIGAGILVGWIDKAGSGNLGDPVTLLAIGGIPLTL